MKHLSDYAANLAMAEQVKRKAVPTWSALREPGRYVPVSRHTLEGFIQRQHQRMREMGWTLPKGGRDA